MKKKKKRGFEGGVGRHRNTIPGSGNASSRHSYRTDLRKGKKRKRPFLTSRVEKRGEGGNVQEGGRRWASEKRGNSLALQMKLGTRRGFPIRIRKRERRIGERGRIPNSSTHDI